MILTKWNRYRDIGLLILRVGIGIMFLFHGWPKLAGGPERWAGLGQAMSTFGITAAPALWGFLAAVSEFFGGLLLIAGLFTRPACMMMLATMLVASSMHLARGDGILGASHAIELGIVFLSLLFIGPGKYSIDERWAARARQG
ncbi:MAG: DoxX family membrane protein [Chitinivibrionales bacterium]|nr:DoxX family membrane protein [Chitinivibrionales bacterium]